MGVTRAVVVAMLLVFATACAQSADPAAQTSTASASASGTSTRASSVPATVTAVDVAPTPQVGAVFLGSDTLHTCTGSVIHSSTGNLILTAAHCLTDGFDTSFVPNFADTSAAGDTWHVDAAYLDPRWVSNQDPLADFALARVSRPDGASVEATVGGGLTIGSTPAIGADVRVTGYPLGVGGSPRGCTARVASLQKGYPTIGCAGLVDGTSGAPWQVGASVVGVTGGLEGGGCDENVSYAAPFDGAITQLLARAEAGGPGDPAPSALQSDC